MIGTSTLQFASANIVTNAAAVVLDGAGSALRNSTNTGDALAAFVAIASASSFTIRNGRNFNSASAFSNAGIVNIGSGNLTNLAGAQLQMAGGTFTSSTLSPFNNAGLVTGFGVLMRGVSNTGSVVASGGTLRVSGSGGVSGASGLIGILPGATLWLEDISSAATLNHNGTLLTLGTNTVTVFGDYTNAGFGIGNAFNRRANISGSGLILAGGTTQQRLSGAQVQNGSTAAATLALGSSRVGLGGASATFTIDNAGGGGPSLRGALQTTGITNAALGGSGVTAQNWGAIAQGASSATYTITFAPTAGQALSGQVLRVVNNFDNVAEQTLTITGNTYNLAQASTASPNPVLLANQRLGAAPLTQTLTITNLASANGFSESLNASFSGSTGSAFGRGSFNLLAPGASSGSLAVGISTATAGAGSGSATIALASDGSTSSGFSALALSAQVVNASGNVYRLANPQVDLTPIALAARVGDAAPARSIAVNNSSPDIYTERLDAHFTATPAGFASAGSIVGLAAGASSNALGVSLNTGSAGNFGGNTMLALVSSGASTTGAPDAVLPSLNVALTGRAYAPAVALLQTPAVDFGIVRLGDTVGARNVRVGNGAVGTLTDTLSASLTAGNAPFGTSGAVSGITAGAFDSSALQVQLSTATAGVYAGASTVSSKARTAS